MKIASTILLALSIAGAVHATPVKISNDNVVRLFNALRAIGPGLTPANTGFAADDLNVLEPKALLHDKVTNKAQRDGFAVSQTDAQRVPKLLAIQDSVSQFGETEVTLDLSLFTVTADEITAAKIRPEDLALIKRFLSPPNPPTK